jgi:hypothetical protein
MSHIRNANSNSKCTTHCTDNWPSRFITDEIINGTLTLGGAFTAIISPTEFKAALSNFAAHAHILFLFHGTEIQYIAAMQRVRQRWRDEGGGTDTVRFSIKLVSQLDLFALIYIIIIIIIYISGVCCGKTLCVIIKFLEDNGVPHTYLGHTHTYFTVPENSCLFVDSPRLGPLTPSSPREDARTLNPLLIDQLEKIGGGGRQVRMR